MSASAPELPALSSAEPVAQEREQKIKRAPPPEASKQMAMGKGKGISAREQMERLAKAGREGNTTDEMKHAPRLKQDSGWAVAEEEVSDTSDSAAPKAEEVQP